MKLLLSKVFGVAIFLALVATPEISQSKEAKKQSHSKNSESISSPRGPQRGPQARGPQHGPKNGPQARGPQRGPKKGAERGSKRSNNPVHHLRII